MNHGQKKAALSVLKAAKRKLAATYSPMLLCTVPSAKKDLTSEFGMGSGMTPFLLPPIKTYNMCVYQIKEASLVIKDARISKSLKNHFFVTFHIFCF